jgi:aminoglycoside phosphotransferase (APT) family kinase protein
VKWSRQPRWIEREVGALERLAPGLGALVPRLLATGTAQGGSYLATSGLQGDPIPPEALEAHLDAVLAALAAIARAARDGDGIEADLRAELTAGRAAGLRALTPFPDLERVASWLSAAVPLVGGTRLPRVAQHGDFVLGNLLWSAHGALGVLDWEDFGGTALPGHDLAVLFATLPPEARRAEARRRASLRTAMAAHARDLGVASEVLTALVPHHLVRFHAAASAEGRDVAAARVRARLAALCVDPLWHGAAR